MEDYSAIYRKKGSSKVTPLLFNFALEYAIRSVHANQDGLKLNGTVYTDDVTIVGGSVIL